MSRVGWSVTLIAVAVLSSSAIGNAQDPVAHYQFNANADNKGTGKGTCYLSQGVTFLDNAVVTYSSHDINSFKDVWCGAPEIRFSRFSLVVRLKCDGFTSKKQEVILVGGKTQWFSLNRSKEGILVLELNHGKYKKDFGGKKLAEDQWMTIACAVDMESHKAVAVVDGELAGEIELPSDLKITTMPEPPKELLVAPLYGDKIFVFVNSGNRSFFKGLVDDLQIYDRVLSQKELTQLTVPKTDKPSTASSQEASLPANPLTPTKSFPTHVLMNAHLENLWVAKSSADGKSVRLVKPKFREEAGKPRTVTKTMLLPETRTRNNESGGAETYTVQVPTSYQEEVVSTESVPDGNFRYIVPVAELKAFKMDGKKIPSEQIAKMLGTPQHVFVSIYFEEDFPGLDPYFRSVFKPEVFLLVLPPTIEVGDKYKDIPVAK
jgi:hypothetical protein